MAAPSHPRYAVVIPTCARHQSLATCLGLIEAAGKNLGEAVEVIVSDDEAAPGARGALESRFPWIQWVEGPHKGPAANRNRGAAQATAEWLVFTDDDCEPEPAWLKAYEEGRRAHPTARVLEGRTSAGAHIGPDEESPVNERGGFLWSCNFAIRRDLFQRIGGFDEGFPFPRLEDVDLRERLFSAHERVIYLPDAAVIHPPRPLRPVVAHIRQTESYFYFSRKHGLTVREAGLNPRALAVTWRDRLRAARGPGRALGALGRALAEAALLAYYVPRWTWKYRRSSPRAVAQHPPSSPLLPPPGPPPAAAAPLPSASSPAVQLSPKPRVLVTGAAGFIGSHVADHCLAAGMEVVATDDLSGGFRENVPAGAEWIQGDLRDGAFVDRLMERGPFEVIYHLGAYAAEGLSHFIRIYNYETNVVASMRLINAAVRSKVKCFVFASSIAVYGHGQLPMSEDMIPQPEDPYGISKYAVELDLRAAREMFGLPYIIFRPHNVYGERQNIADRYRNVLGIFMNQTLRGEPMSVFGDGLQTRAFSHVDDVAPLIARAPSIPAAINEVFNIGADTPYSVLDLAAEVARALAQPLNVTHLPARNEVVHAFSDHAKLRRVFGQSETVSLRDGIQRMADWVRRQGPREPVRFDQIEIREKLPPSWA